ncbi:hypothetical protein BJX99DRAFT_260477 [Aspergillus californicus]
MALEGTGTLSEILVLDPPSTRSSHRLRSSPSRLSDARYRGENLWRASILIDVEILAYISKHVDNIFAHSSMSDAVLHIISEKLCSKSQELASKSAGEAEWTGALHLVIDDLKQSGLGVVRNRDWREDLKPPVHQPQSRIPRERQQNASTHLSNPSESAFSLPIVPIFKLKDPRLDICVGLSDESLIEDLETKKGHNIARRFLLGLQDTSSLISDPHVTPAGLHFPFLVIETKSGATGGNLYQAQNQAAGSGSTALRIMQNTLELQDILGPDHRGHHEDQEDVEVGNQPERVPNLAFSITTEGPVHQLWFHFQSSSEDFCMSCVGSWRTTNKDGSMNLLRHLLAVLRWGNNEFRNSIIRAL